GLRRYFSSRDPAPPPRTALTSQHSVRCTTPRCAHLRTVCESILRLRRERGAKPRTEDARQHSQIDTLTELTRQDRFGVVFAERCISRQREIHNGGEREVIRRRALLLSKQLLGRRKRRSPGRSGNVFAGNVGNSEIGDAPSIVAIDENVLGLEIPMQNSIRMRDDQTVENLV